MSSVLRPKTIEWWRGPASFPSSLKRYLYCNVMYRTACPDRVAHLPIAASVNTCIEQIRIDLFSFFSVGPWIQITVVTQITRGMLDRYSKQPVLSLWSSILLSLCWNFRTIYEARNRVGIGWSYRPARLHRPVAGKNDNSVPTWFLAPTDNSKIPEPVFVNL
jgi:hypothetical protein